MLVALLAERSDGSDDFIAIKDGDTFLLLSIFYFLQLMTYLRRPLLIACRRYADMTRDILIRE